MPLNVNKATETEQKLFNYISKVVPDFDFDYFVKSDANYELAGVSLEDLTINDSIMEYYDGLFMPEASETIWRYSDDFSGLPNDFSTVGGVISIKEGAKILERKGILIISKTLPPVFINVKSYKKHVFFMNKEGDIEEFDREIESYLNLGNYLNYWNKQREVLEND